jgi:hypothetical protein
MRELKAGERSRPPRWPGFRNDLLISQIYGEHYYGSINPFLMAHLTI